MQNCKYESKYGNKPNGLPLTLNLGGISGLAISNYTGWGNEINPLNYVLKLTSWLIVEGNSMKFDVCWEMWGKLQKTWKFQSMHSDRQYSIHFSSNWKISCRLYENRPKLMSGRKQASNNSI